MGTWIGVGVGVFFGALAVIFYFRSRREKKLQLRMKSFNLIGRAVSSIMPDKIRVTYINPLSPPQTAFTIAFSEP